MKRRLAAIAAAPLAAAVLWAGASMAQESFSSGGLGPLRFGMGADAVRAALPQAAWTETLQSRSGKKWKLSAPAALTLFGAAFDVDVEMDYHSSYLIRARRTVPGNFAACEKLGLDAISSLEPEFGRFERSVGGPFLKACFDSKEMFCAKNIRTIPTPGGSEVRRMSMDSKGRLFDAANTSDRRIAVHGLGAEHRLPGDDRSSISVFARHEASACELTLMADRPREMMMEAERIPPEKVVFRRQPTIGARHNTAIQLAALPAEGATFPFRCSILRSEGATYCNTLRDQLPTKEGDADIVRQAADQLVVDIGAFDLDDPAGLEFDHDFRVTPADIRPVRIDPATAVPFGQVVGSRAVPGRTLRLSRISEQIVHQDLVKPDMVFGVLCEVVEDYSLACARPDTSGVSPLLGQAGLGLASRIQMPEKLADGSASLGRTVRVTLAFEVVDADGKGSKRISTR